jgi:hypothetical protein
MAGPTDAGVLVGRRYLKRGFVDAALKLFVRNAGSVTTEDWTLLRDRLIERGRFQDAIRVCELGDIPLPTDRLLEVGDRHLQRKDVDMAIHLYELAGADRERWSRVLDVLVVMPERERQAIEVAERYLSSGAPAAEVQDRRMKIVK